jgi:hypothetical protein
VLEFLDTVAADPYESTAEYRVVVGRDSCDAIFSGGHGFVTYEVREAAGTINVVAVTPAAS